MSLADHQIYHVPFHRPQYVCGENALSYLNENGCPHPFPRFGFSRLGNGTCGRETILQSN